MMIVLLILVQRSGSIKQLLLHCSGGRECLWRLAVFFKSDLFSIDTFLNKDGHKND